MNKSVKRVFLTERLLSFISGVQSEAKTYEIRDDLHLLATKCDKVAVQFHVKESNKYYTA